MVLESLVSSAPVAASIQDRYEALFRVSRTISAHRDPEELFRVLAAELRGVVEFDAMYCTHYDPTEGVSAFCMIETPSGRLPTPDFAIETSSCCSTPQRRKQTKNDIAVPPPSAARLRMLRAHGLIRKRPRSHRYDVSPQGRLLLNAILSAHTLTVQ